MRETMVENLLAQSKDMKFWGKATWRRLNIRRLRRRCHFRFGTLPRVTDELNALVANGPLSFLIRITQAPVQRRLCVHWASWVPTFRLMQSSTPP